MSDFRNDPNFARHELRDYDNNRIQWAAVAVLLLLVGGLIVAASFTGGERQTAMNGPAVETTGSGGSLGSTAANPPAMRTPRH